MNRLLWTIHTLKRFFIIPLGVCNGLQSMVTKSPAVLYSALYPSTFCQSDYKVDKKLYAHIPDLPTAWDTVGSSGGEVLSL